MLRQNNFFASLASKISGIAGNPPIPLSTTRKRELRGFESLEERRLLDGEGLDSPQYELGEILTPGPDGPVALDPQLISREPVLIDRSDFYWSDDTRIALSRSADEMVIALKQGNELNEAFELLTRDGGTLQDFAVTRVLDSRHAIVSRKDMSIGSQSGLPLEQIARDANIDWASEVLVSAESGTRMFLTDQIVVKLRDGVDPEEFFADGYESYQALFEGQWVARLKGPGGITTLERANSLTNSELVEWAVPDFYQDYRVATNDPLYTQQWHLKNTGQYSAKVDADSDVEEAWSATTGSPYIVVAVLDNGVQLNHPDLPIYENFPEDSGTPGVDDDGNGFVDDISGWDFIGASGTGDNNAGPHTTFDNHGTNVAGVAAAKGSNSLGVTGVSQDARIMPIKIARDDTGSGGGFASDSTIARAVYYASGAIVDVGGSVVGRWRGADILVNSWGGGSSNPVLTAAINWATSSGRNNLGAVTFFAAGNEAAGTGAQAQYVPVVAEFDVSSYGTANWSWVISYRKNASGTLGEDTARLSRFINADGISTRWDATSAPAGWNMTPFAGQSGWSVEDNPAGAHGTGRYQARATAIGNSQNAYLMAPSVARSAGNGLMTATAYTWRSSAAGDRLHFSLWNHNTSTLIDVGYLEGQTPNADTPVNYPGNLASVISVGAATDWDYRSHYSQYGAELDLVAPSGGGYANITTTDRTGAAGAAGDYASFSGTSAATPLAAGAAALLLSKNPTLTAANIRTALQNTADKIGGNNGAAAYVSGHNQFYGYGRVNANSALAAVSADTTPPKIVAVTVASSLVPDTYSVPAGTGVAQLTTANVRSANQIRITFSEELRFTYPIDLLAFINNATAKGINGVDYTWGDIEYDRVNHTAIFTLDPAVHPNGFQFTHNSTTHAGDKLLVTLLSSGIKDIAGNDLDGEWSNPTTLNLTASDTFPSGNGVAGGDFKFRIVMLPGDANRDNQVNLTDHGIVSANFGLSGGWNIGNFDSNTTVDLSDFGKVSSNFGYVWTSWASTPAGPGAPMAPGPKFAQKLPASLIPDRWRELETEDDLAVLAEAHLNEESAKQAAGWWAAFERFEEDEEDSALAVS